jgi:hypothetical protein
LAFSLYTAAAPAVTIAASASPVLAGVVTGAGSYPINSTATLDAIPNAGWGFVNWTQSGSPVSANPHYTFPAVADRTLVANFVTAYSITTASSPSYGGTITGAGIYNAGSTVTVVATPHYGFDFAGWSDGGTTPTHSFPATADSVLTAFFVSSPLSATFNFDDAPAYTTLPLGLVVDGLSASFTANSTSGGTFAIWPYDTWGIRPLGFEGLSLFPTTVFGADLIVDFSQTLVDFSVLYMPQELGCDDTATMRATAYMNGAFVGTATAMVPVPGTYPTGTLSIAVPTGFNRVVVHYDARPPTCQDWGPIFFADNVTVTRQCVAPAITMQPASTSICSTGNATFSVAAVGTSIAYQWQAETTFGSGIFAGLADGVVPGVGLVTGSQLANLGVGQPPSAAQHRFRCMLINPCGSATSTASTLTICPADMTCDGGVDINDLLAFLSAFELGTPAADLDNGTGTGTPDGGVDINDLLFFLVHFEAGC